MINLKAKIEEVKQKLADARQRQAEAYQTGEWDEDADDFTALSCHILNANDAEVEALEKQLEWLEYADKKRNLSVNAQKLLDDVEDLELKAEDFFNNCDRRERDELGKLYLEIRNYRKNLMEALA